VRLTLETDMESSSHVIPSQLHELLPLHEDSKTWLWLSRLAFHFNKALASLLCKVEEVDAIVRVKPTIEEERLVMSGQKYIEKNSQKSRHFMTSRVGHLRSYRVRA
jgi:hypothetical protein